MFLLYHWELGGTLIHFVNSQTTVRKYLLPRVDCGRGPTQSIWRSEHGKVIPFLCSGARWFGFAGMDWQHTRHPLTHSATSCCMPGQYATCLSVSLVALAPWCPAHGASWACQHNPPLALRDYELWHCEGLREICENTMS